MVAIRKNVLWAGIFMSASLLKLMWKLRLGRTTNWMARSITPVSSALPKERWLFPPISSNMLRLELLRLSSKNVILS